MQSLVLNVKYMTITNCKILSVQQGEFGTYEEIVAETRYEAIRAEREAAAKAAEEAKVTPQKEERTFDTRNC